MSDKTELVIIAAVARNRAIGLNNTLPWRLRADLAHFKAQTKGHPVIMGRKTWESLGRALPNRRNIVITRNTDYIASGAEVFTSPEQALKASSNHSGPVFLIGGADLYRQLISGTDRLLITEVHADILGDAFFPDIDPKLFCEISRQHHPADNDNDYAFDFVEYQRQV